MGYKILWLLLVMIPLPMEGNVPSYAYLYAAGFLSYINGDVIAIPVHQLFKNDGGR